MKTPAILKRFLIWRMRNMDSKPYMMVLSLFVGIFSGLMAVLLFNLVHFIKDILAEGVTEKGFNFIYLAYPIVGISLVLLFVKYILRQYIGHGITGILYDISKNQAIIKAHAMFSSVITSALTVGFGGSVGLEGPAVASGGAVGSNVGRLFRLNFKQRVLLIGCGSAAAIAAIFKAPIAGIVFAFEVIMLDLTTASVIPILIAASSAALTSFALLGQDVIYPFELKTSFIVRDLPYYLGLGVFSGFISVYFSRLYLYITDKFEKVKSKIKRLFIGGGILGLLILFFPSLYGDGYESINLALLGEKEYLFEHSFFSRFSDSVEVALFLLFSIVLLKVIASASTFGAGGIGGLFAPSLFVGANTGLLFASVLQYFGIRQISVSNFALVGMAGLLAGIMHAPLTGIFMIAEITGGYALFMPLMITATISYATVKYFDSNSIYTVRLAKRNALLTHHADKNVLYLMKVDKLIETNFHPIDINASLGDLVKVVAKSNRNIFPVVDENNYFIGVVELDDIRQIMFNHDLYKKVFVKDLMYIPSSHVTPDDSMEDVAKKIQQSGKFNIIVLKDGKYLGFVSRANVFSKYRKMVKSISAD
jgi:chloride channel protein, CIC family